MPEVLRFYYGTSMKMLNAAMAPPLDAHRNALYDVERSGMRPDGRCVVYPRRELRPDDVRMIVAFLSSAAARTSARRVFDSLLLCWRDGREAYPEVFPPFSGLTDLALQGQWLGAGQYRRRFLGLRIVHAGLPLPVRSILVIYKMTGEREFGWGSRIAFQSSRFFAPTPIHVSESESIADISSCPILAEHPPATPAPEYRTLLEDALADQVARAKTPEEAAWWTEKFRMELRRIMSENTICPT
jgi:hypothetical protein